MRNTGLDEAQVGIKIAGRNINNLRYANDTTLMMKVKEESKKPGLKLNIKKVKIMGSSPITSWQIEGEKGGSSDNFLFLGSKITGDVDWGHEIRR